MRLQERFSQVITRRGLAPATHEAYWFWVDKYLRYHREQNGGQWVRPEEMRERHVEQYLTHLAVDEHVAASTRNRAHVASLRKDGR